MAAAEGKNQCGDMDEDHYIFVAAIDFGTTHSGYAFSRTHDPTAIQINKNWGAELSFQSYKCPTSVLTDIEGSFVSFGFTAENDFCVKTENKKAEGFNLFRNFKMMLLGDKLNLESEVTSTTGTKRRAIDIFAMALNYFKDDIFRVLKQACVKSLDSSMIRWVITVPAIWRDMAKRFMREAAFKAGIIKDSESRQLIIALEPEAGSLFCRDVQLRLGPSKEDNYFKKGSRYMVVDAGGGTVDITVHEVAGDKKVRELFYATGGAWGAVTVDKNFEALLTEIFSENMMQNFKDKFPQDWMCCMLHFEKAKMVTPEGTIQTQLPYNFQEIFNEVFPEENFDNFVGTRSAQQVTFDSGLLMVQNEKVKSLFDFAITKTIDQIQSILQKVADIGTILLVGGFAQCSMLEEAVKNRFAAQKVIIPTSAQLAIMKGAVLFGHDPSVISVRVARLTYGIGVMRPFDESKHDKKHAIYDYGKKMCNNLFKLSIRQKQEVETGTVVKCDLGVNETSQKKGCATLTLFSTSQDDVTYITDDRVNKLANIKVPLKSIDVRSELAVHVEYGATELLFRAQDKESQEWVEAKVDFLEDKA